MPIFKSGTGRLNNVKRKNALRINDTQIGARTAKRECPKHEEQITKGKTERIQDNNERKRPRGNIGYLLLDIAKCMYILLQSKGSGKK